VGSNLKIIYRFCDNRILTGYTNITKFDCLYNFINVFGEGFTILFDNTNKTIVNDFVKSNRFNVIETSLGNSGSFNKCLDIIQDFEDEDLVYLVEDDYLHKPGSQDILIEGLEKAKWVTLYDHPDKYMNNGPNPLVHNSAEQSRIYLTNSTHWKTTNSTTMTFAAKAKDIKSYSNIMKNYLKHSVPDDFNMWRAILQDSELISPIPGYSTHCQEPWISPLHEWKPK